MWPAVPATKRFAEFAGIPEVFPFYRLMFSCRCAPGNDPRAPRRCTAKSSPKGASDPGREPSHGSQALCAEHLCSVHPTVGKIPSRTSASSEPGSRSAS